MQYKDRIYIYIICTLYLILFAYPTTLTHIRNETPSVQCATPGSSQAAGLLKPEGILQWGQRCQVYLHNEELPHISSFNKHQYYTHIQSHYDTSCTNYYSPLPSTAFSILGKHKLEATSDILTLGYTLLDPIPTTPTDPPLQPRLV